MSLRALARLLVEERDHVVPLIGSGLCLEAGLPSAVVLAEALASDAGLELADPRDFGVVCRAIEDAEGLTRLQELAAAKIGAVEVVATPTLKAIAGCPSQCILTTNYDTASEDAVRAIGKRPKTICLDEAWTRTPSEDEVFVIHLHGVIDRPETMVLTTRQRSDLVANEGFRTQLAALRLGARVLALGLRFSAEEPHLRAEFRWLASALPAERPPIVVVPPDEVDDELGILSADGIIDLHECDPNDGFLEVRQCAQVLSPGPVDPTEVITRLASAVPQPYCPTPLLGPKQLADATNPAMAAMFAGTRFGTPLARLEDLLEDRYVLLEAAPGRGKSVTLARLGELTKGRSIRCDLRDFDPVEEDPARGLARLLSLTGQAFDQGTPVPSTLGLAEGSYVFLLDGFDESGLARQAEIVDAIEAASERWPQHTYVVATRPTSEVARFEELGFITYRIEATETWGREYLAANGITEEQVTELYERVPTIGEHVAIPRYAALIAKLILEGARGEEVPSGALELMALGERKNLEVSANRLVVDLDELLEWARRLAVGLELHGHSSAGIEEITALPAPQGHSSREAREDLIRSALLQDIPDQASFSAHVSQEVLCAEAMLRSSDPLATLREAAIAEVNGLPELRDDMDHTLDLFFEGAGLQLREQLRELDPLRWARTQTPSADDVRVVEAIETIWSWHREKRLWIQVRGEGLLRGPGEALKLLNAGAPGYLESKRAQLLEECGSPERTIRGNAVEILTLLTEDADTEATLSRLLGDEDDVVRRHVAHAVEHLGLTGLLPRLFDAWVEETDELGFEALGFAIAALASEEELLEAIGSLREMQAGWRRVSYRFLARVSITALPELIAADKLGLGDAEEVLEARFGSEEPWSGEEVEALARLLVLGGPRFSGHKHHEQISRLVSEFPDEAFAGARAGAGEETRDLDLLWLADLPLETLKGEAEGVLARPLCRIVERREWQQENLSQLEAGDRPGFFEEEDEDEDATDLAGLLAEGKVAENWAPPDGLLWQLPNEPVEVVGRVSELAEVWYRESGVPPVLREGSRVTTSIGLKAAVIVWAALDRDLDRERWFALLGSQIASVDSRICEWMTRHWEEDWSAQAAEMVAGLSDPQGIVAAATAIAGWDRTLREIFAAKVLEVPDEAAAHALISRLGENQAAEELRQVAGSATVEEVREWARNELAALGDVAAQRELLERIRDALAENPFAYERDGPHWLGAVTSPDLAELLGSILHAAHASSETSMLRRQVEGALRGIANPRCIAVYDELIAASDLREPQFYWYQRQALVRHMARIQVLGRLDQLGEQDIPSLVFSPGD